MLGWSGIAVDALEEFSADYRTFRRGPGTSPCSPRTWLIPLSSSLFLLNKLVSSVSRDFTARYGAAGTERTVPTTTLNAVLEQASISRVDFLSMDIELSEPKALAGLDIERYRPDLVCIEGHDEVRQQILDYFARHGYTVIGRYLRADPKNLYFQPLPKASP